DGLGVELLVVDHRGPPQPVLQRGDPLLEHRLLVLGVVVLGVLRDVPELPRLLDAVSNLAALVVLEVLEFLLELLEPLGGDQCLACQLSSIPSVSGFARRLKSPAQRPKNEPAPTPNHDTSGPGERASIAPPQRRVESAGQAGRDARMTSATRC